MIGTVAVIASITSDALVKAYAQATLGRENRYSIEPHKLDLVGSTPTPATICKISLPTNAKSENHSPAPSEMQSAESESLQK